MLDEDRRDKETKRKGPTVFALTVATISVAGRKVIMRTVKQIQDRYKCDNVHEGCLNSEGVTTITEVSNLGRMGIKENTYGGMRLMSTEEPAPGEAGFSKLISTMGQFSPLRPHDPSKGSNM